jgi:hypothetical protein
MDTRAGYGRMLVWSSVLAAILWPVTYFAAVNAQFSMTLLEVNIVTMFVIWATALGGMTLVHRRARRVADARVQTALDQSDTWSTSKKKRPAEAPWWRDEADEADEKLKRDAVADQAELLLDDDGEFYDGRDTQPRQRLT